MWFVKFERMKGRINVNKLLDDFVFQDDGTSVNLLFETYVQKIEKNHKLNFFWMFR